MLVPATCSVGQWGGQRGISDAEMGLLKRLDI